MKQAPALKISGRILVSILLSLCAVHLALGTLEVLHRPVFPWDAWTNWMYRAKAWFLTGEITSFDPVVLWASGEEPQNRYAVPGHNYPDLLPLMAYGVSSVLGYWSETLVNLPTILCGLLLAVGTYWIARQYGYSRTVSGALTYLVVSTPLIGAHLSLAGQADIWMALFCGLGFVLICAGLIRQRTGLALAGLALVALSTQLKVEGIVWLFAALLLVATGSRPRIVIGGALALILGAGVAFLLGFRQMELPLLGIIGFGEDRLYASFLGSYALQHHDLANDYLSNFLLGGSWNLLWYLVLAAVLAAAVQARRNRPAAVALAFFLITAAVQVLIFFFTEQGAWAKDWTAINRLPLHFSPALIFASACVLLPPKETAADRLQFNLATLTTLGLVTAIAGVFWLLASNEDSMQQQAALHRGGSTLRTVIGVGEPDGEALRIRRFVNNVALASTGKISVDAALAPIVRVATRGSNRQELTLFWRSGTGGDLYREKVAGLGTLFVELGDHENWTGLITELGIVAYDDGGVIEIESLSLHEPSIGIRFKQIFADWRWIAPWSQRSLHWLASGNPGAILALPLLGAVVFLVLAVTCLILLRSAPARQRAAGVAGIFLALWIACDVRWIAQRISLARHTVATYPLMGSGPLAFGDDRIGAAAVERATCDLLSDKSPDAPGASRPRLLIATDSDKDMRFQVWRAKYHALPVPAHAHEKAFDSLPAGVADRVLVLKLRYGRQESRIYSSQEASAILAGRTGRSIRTAWEDDNAYMLLVGDEPGNARCWREKPNA